jgi:hypothetical protein
MAVPVSSDVPGYGPDKRTDITIGGRDTGSTAGTRDGGADPTTEPGQYPPGGWGAAIFGGPLPEGTGAPGTQGGRYDGDPTIQDGALVDGFSGVSEHDVTSTGAPGTQGAVNHPGQGPDAVMFTRPGSAQSGSYAADTVRDSISGPLDWTGANDSAYGTDGPKLPGMAEPVAGNGVFQPRATGGTDTTQAGAATPGNQGHVMRGGRMVHQG